MTTGPTRGGEPPSANLANEHECVVGTDGVAGKRLHEGQGGHPEPRERQRQLDKHVP